MYHYLSESSTNFGNGMKNKIIGLGRELSGEINTDYITANQRINPGIYCGAKILLMSIFFNAITFEP